MPTLNVTPSKPEPYFDLTRLRTRWFYINLVSAPILLVGTFLPWFATTASGRINGDAGTFSAWQTFGAFKYYLLWCSIGSVTVAPWIAARRDRLSWTPGELSIFFAIVGVGLILFNGFISRPGEPSGEIHLRPGFWLALIGMLGLTYAGAIRARSHLPARKPPGTV
jgi:hypothetical protein